MKVKQLKLTQFQLLLLQCQQVPLEEVVTVNFAAGYCLCRLLPHMDKEDVDELLKRCEQFMANDPNIKPEHARIALNTLQAAVNRTGMDAVILEVFQQLTSDPAILKKMLEQSVDVPEPENPNRN